MGLPHIIPPSVTQNKHHSCSRWPYKCLDQEHNGAHTALTIRSAATDPESQATKSKVLKGATKMEHPLNDPECI